MTMICHTCLREFVLIEKYEDNLLHSGLIPEQLSKQNVKQF